MKATSPIPGTLTARAIQKELAGLANKEQARFLGGFFKTGPGQYGEGDRFRGIRVPVTRSVARRYSTLPIEECEKLLDSPWHEDRLLALIVLCGRFAKENEGMRKQIFHLYLKKTNRINNWDLVDISAGPIVGATIYSTDRSLLHRLIRSRSLWERRVAIMATQFFIRQGDLDETFRLVEAVLQDREDLIHKAAGWMLREAGKRDLRALENFLSLHAPVMPRTMLRYAIEKLPREKRTMYMDARSIMQA